MEQIEYLDEQGLQTLVELIKQYTEHSEAKVKITDSHFKIPSGQTFATLKDALAQLVTEQEQAFSLEVQADGSLKLIYKEG